MRTSRSYFTSFTETPAPSSGGLWVLGSGPDRNFSCGLWVWISSEISRWMLMEPTWRWRLQSFSDKKSMMLLSQKSFLRNKFKVNFWPLSFKLGLLPDSCELEGSVQLSLGHVWRRGSWICLRTVGVQTVAPGHFHEHIKFKDRNWRPFFIRPEDLTLILQRPSMFWLRSSFRLKET